MILKKLLSIKKKINFFKKENNNSPFFYYTSNFDAETIIREFKKNNLEGEQGFITNYMGIKFPTKILSSFLDSKSGSIDHIPIPANWHTDIIEIGSVLKIVKESGETFKMIEIGSGWGCWMTISGCAAKMLNKSVEVIGIEGSKTYCNLSIEVLKKNNFKEDEFKIFNKIIGKKKGFSLFPKNENDADWGMEAKIYPTEDEIKNAQKSDNYNIVERVPLSDILNSKVDLIHMDIQGSEVDFIREQFNILVKYAKNIVIGTHSRLIDGQLIEFFQNKNFKLCGERPTLTKYINDEIITMTDGLQFWKNLNIQ